MRVRHDAFRSRLSLLPMLARCLVLLLVLISCFPRMALAQPATAVPGGCIVPAEPNDQPSTATELPAGAACVAATAQAASQDIYRWTVGEAESARRWTIGVSGIAGQATILEVYHVELDATGTVTAAQKLLSRTSNPGEPIAHPNLLWPAGTYYIAVAASGPGDYQLTVAEGDPVPPAAPADGSPVEATGAFGVAFAPGMAPAPVTWRIDGASAASRWLLRAQGAVGEYVSLSITDGSGATQLTVQAGPDGVASVPDIGLEPGAYTLSASLGSGSTAPAIIEIVPQDARAADRENEPNDVAGSGMAIPLTEQGATVNGRLATVTAATTDIDRYTLTIDPTLASRLIDIRLLWRDGPARKLCLVDSEERELRCAEGEQGVALSDLVLREGTYAIVISGPASPDDPYVLRLDVTSEASTGFEAEPNDAKQDASPLAVDGEGFASSGRLAPNDIDIFRMTVSGEPQLWQVDATGSGLGDLMFLDATGTAVVRTTATNGAARIIDLYLVPGDHWFRVSGGSGDYELVATPLGPPDPQREREPNDTLDTSQPIRLLEERTGRLVTIDDRDVYRFSLQDTTFLHMDLAMPADGGAVVSLERAGMPVARISSAAPGESITSDWYLPPGDYALWVGAATPSEELYTLTLTPLDPFATPADLEPNDTAALAREFPVSGTLSGLADPRMGYGADDDWYRIAARESGGTVRISSEPGVTAEVVTDDVAATPITLVPGSEAGVVTAELPAGTPVLVHLKGSGTYEISLDDAEAGPTLRMDATLDLGDAEIAAYWREGQRIDGELALRNTGTAPARVTLAAMTGNAQWVVELPDDAIEVAPGAEVTVPLAVHVAPDAWADAPVFVAIQASDGNGHASTMATIVPSREAPPLNAERWDPLPPELLGGLDAAWIGLGAAPVAADAAVATEQAMLQDSVAPVDTGWSEDAAMLPYELVVNLAGDEPVPVAGIVLKPMVGPQSPQENAVRQFELELSLDGVTFEPALAGEMRAVALEQPFVLDQPRDARFARLRILSAQSPDATYVALGVWKVVAEPGWTLPGSGPGLNLADPLIGGHVVDLQPPPSSNPDLQLLLTGDGARQTLPVASGAPVSWIMGFHHDRAALVTSIEWVDPTGSDPATRFNDVLVEVSTESPTGPWVSPGTWTLERDDSGHASLELPAGTWARFVRITGATPSTGDGSTLYWELPESILVHEAAPDATYRSILGEWGEYAQAASFERLVAPESIVPGPDAGNDAQGATVLPIGERLTDTADTGVDEDWYRVEIPQGMGALTIRLEGSPALGVTVTLLDDSGSEIPMQETRVSGRESTYTAPVEPGETYLLRITKPPTSVVISFDTSGSIGALQPAVYQGLARFATDVRRGQEVVNVLPFGEELLLPAWSDDAYEIQGAVAAYPRTSSSSDAEGALLTSMEALAPREGTRAIILITDAESGPMPEQMAKLWPNLGSTAPRVYSIGIAGGGTPTHNQDVMQDWAAVNTGTYVYVTGQAGLDVAFDRAATELRRPSVYTVSVEVSAPEPTPTPAPTPTQEPTATPAPDGSITVTAPIAVPGQGPSLPASPDTSVAIILDTSGSMLQPLEGSTRADVAKSALTGLVTNTIPPGTTVSLRTFGDVPDSCDTRLVVPPGPLDPAAMSATIAGVPVVNLVRTPIGASLEAVAGDLGTSPGPKIVVLVTDGEETCDGDPAAAIQALVASGIDVRVNIVGFAIDDAALREQFTAWARLGNGQYFDAGSATELDTAIATAVLPPYEVVDASGNVVGRGQVGGAAVTVPPGTYTVRILTEPAITIESVVVEPGQGTTVDAGSP